MADLSRYAGDGLKHGSNILAGIVGGSLSLSPQIQQLIAYNDGFTDPTFAATLTNEISLDVDIRDIDYITDVVALDTTIAYAKAYADNGVQGAGSISYSMTGGLLVPQRLTAQAGQNAVMSLRAYPVSTDGSTVPVAVGVSSNTLGVHGAPFVLGQIFMGDSTEIANVKSFTLDFGITVMGNPGENGKPFAREYFVTRRAPKITIETVDLSESTQARINTGALHESNISASFWVCQEGGVPTSSGALTLTAVKAVSKISGHKHDSPSSATIEADLISNGTTFMTWS